MSVDSISGGEFPVLGNLDPRNPEMPEFFIFIISLRGGQEIRFCVHKSKVSEMANKIADAMTAYPYATVVVGGKPDVHTFAVFTEDGDNKILTAYWWLHEMQGFFFEPVKDNKAMQKIHDEIMATQLRLMKLEEINRKRGEDWRGGKDE